MESLKGGREKQTPFTDDNPRYKILFGTASIMTSTLKVHSLLNPILQTFRVLAKKGSFSKTAEELCITQPAVSIHIKSLEEYYRVGLFDKVDRKFVLTEAGRTLYSYTERLFNLTDETRRTLNEFSDLQRGSLYLGASSNIGVYILPSFLGRFKNKFPKLTIKVSIGNTRTIEHKILSSELDIGLVEAPIRSSEIAIEPWRDERLIVVTSPSHHFVKLNKITPHQLIDEPFMVGEGGSGTGRVLREKLPTIADKLKIFLELGSTEAVKRAVEEGLGISIVGESTVYRELKTGRLKEIHINGVNLQKKFNFVYLKGKIFTPTMIEFINCLREQE